MLKPFANVVFTDATHRRADRSFTCRNRCDSCWWQDAFMHPRRLRGQVSIGCCWSVRRRQILPGAGADLAVVEADLSFDKSWPEAVAGCTYVLHVASPFPITEPKNENELVRHAPVAVVVPLRCMRSLHACQ